MCALLGLVCQIPQCCRIFSFLSMSSAAFGESTWDYVLILRKWGCAELLIWALRHGSPVGIPVHGVWWPARSRTVTSLNSSTQHTCSRPLGESAFHSSYLTGFGRCDSKHLLWLLLFLLLLFLICCPSNWHFCAGDLSFVTVCFNCLCFFFATLSIVSLKYTWGRISIFNHHYWKPLLKHCNVRRALRRVLFF